MKLVTIEEYAEIKGIFQDEVKKLIAKEDVKFQVVDNITYVQVDDSFEYLEKVADEKNSDMSGAETQEFSLIKTINLVTIILGPVALFISGGGAISVGDIGCVIFLIISAKATGSFIKKRKNKIVVIITNLLALLSMVLTSGAFVLLKYGAIKMVYGWIILALLLVIKLVP